MQTHEVEKFYTYSFTLTFAVRFKATLVSLAAVFWAVTQRSPTPPPPHTKKIKLKSNKQNDKRLTKVRVAIQINLKFGWFQNASKNQIARPKMKLISKIYGRISVWVKCKRQSHRGNFSGKNCLQSRNLPCCRTGQFTLRLYSCCYSLFSVSKPS